MASLDDTRHPLFGRPLRRGRPLAYLTLTLAVLCVACGASADDSGRQPLATMGSSTGGGEANVIPPGMTALSAARLDSGNVAFRRRQYDEALRYYRAAANDVPSHPAPWYGIYMVAQATGNRALADSATQAVAARNGGEDLLQQGNAQAHQAPTTALPPNRPIVPQ